MKARVAGLERAAACLLLPCLLLAGALRGAAGQEIQLGEINRAAAAKTGHVALLSDAVVVSAGKAQSVELRFRVDPGFHINSHKPADELMMPTSLHLEPNPRVTVAEAKFPPGVPFRLEAGDVLDVYEGEFRVVVQLAAVERGENTLSGTLRYQACDRAACFPPRSLPVRVALTAK